MIIEEVTVIEHRSLVKPITLITIQVFDLSSIAGVKVGELLPNLAQEVEKPLHHDRECGIVKRIP
jgi:hypothetical protein